LISRRHEGPPRARRGAPPLERVDAHRVVRVVPRSSRRARRRRIASAVARAPRSARGASAVAVSRRAVAALAALLVFPLFVAVIGFHKPTWTPVLDLAQTELRVRDVGTSHTPLIGLPGRILYDGQQGSHPGPLSFYALAPMYRLFGSTAFALQLATFVLNAGAVVVALALARRRGGTALVLGVGAAIAVLITGFGVTTLTEPWNPYLPLLWWLVVLLAVWSVLSGDIR